MTRGGADLLATIVAATRRLVAVRQAERPVEVLAREAERARPRGDAFCAALTNAPSPRIIAECKRRSPSRGVLRADYDPASHARAYQAAGAAAISVLTEPTFFDGALEHLRAVRAAVELPLLRKDFILSEYQLLEARAAGADAVLLIVGALDKTSLRTLLETAKEMGLAALAEVHDEADLECAADAGATIVGVNSRNLQNLEVDLAVLQRLAPRLPAEVVAIAESGLKSRADLEALESAGYHAFLIGERFMTSRDPGRALGELRGCSAPGAGAAPDPVEVRS